MFDQLLSRVNRSLWRHVETFLERRRWQRGLLHAAWVGVVVLAALWMMKFDCLIC